MSTLYKRAEFTASSGNHANVKVYAPPAGTDQMAIDVTWERRPSNADIAEADEWAHDAVPALYPNIYMRRSANVVVEDDHVRQRLIDAVNSGELKLPE